MVDGGYSPLFFDRKRFLDDINTGNPVSVFKNALEAARGHFNNRFHEGENVHTLVNEQARFVDLILHYAWERFSWDNDIALLAVGGYGRGELHPHSDIDLLILLRRNSPKKYRENIEQFLTFLWDIQLKIGHSVRSIAQCVEEARNDITVVTNLMETRMIWGDPALRDNLRKKTGPKKIWPSAAFYRGKMDEQNERHRKHQNTEYNLEPNVKEAPGGLRDIQVLNWVAKRHFDVERRSALVRTGFLSEDEYNTLRKDEEFLWKVRYGLHLVAGRPEERLLFDHQRELASMLGYQDSDGKLGIEKFMQQYYQTVLSIRELNDVLLQYLDEAIYRKDKVKTATPLNERFVVRDGYIDTTSERVFPDTPSALLELFVLLGENEQISGVRASTIRQLRLHRRLIDDNFRADPENRKLFLRLLRSPCKLTLQLQRMNRYGILGAYLPEFGRIVGQTQHDLFHIFPVDVHTLEVIRNIRRLTRADVGAKFPVASHIYKNLPKPELLIIAALYHDIAKGRGGDHSILGSDDIADFAERHGLQTQEIELLRWLVENHLLMSTVSQREDTSDPDVIYKFAQHVGNQMRLDMLYTLTVADINATNPNLWTDWKGSLMRNLYFETKRALQRGLGQPVDKSAWVASTKQTALEILADMGIPESAVEKEWRDIGDELFLRESAKHIAEFTRVILEQTDPNAPVVTLRDAGIETPVATQVFIYSRDRQNIFAVAAATFDRLHLNIQDARLHTTCNERSFDVFYVLDEAGHPIGSDKQLSSKVVDSLRNAILNPSTVRFDIQRRTPRQLKHFTLKTIASIRNDVETETSILEVITPDRPGLLAHLARIFLRFGLRLLNAKISTLGERVEDVFYLTDYDYQPLSSETFCKKLTDTICRELDARNREDMAGREMQNMKLWQ